MGVDVLLLYTSYLGALILASQFAGFMFSLLRNSNSTAQSERASKKVGAALGSVSMPQFLIWCSAALVAFLIFYPWIHYTFARPHLAPASEVVDPRIPLRIIKELGDNSYPMAILLLAGMILGIRALMRHGQQNALIWLVTWLIVPIPLLLGIEVWAGYFFAIRHLLHATPPIILLCGYGLSSLGKRLAILPNSPDKISFPAIAFSILMICGSVWIGYVHTHGVPADWSGTAAFLHKNVHAGDAVSMPKISALLAYYDPGLEAYVSGDLDPGSGSLSAPGVQRRIVVCYNNLFPDPCAPFRIQAQNDSAWIKHHIAGFTLFLRSR